MNTNVINQVTMLTLMMIVGIILRKAKIITDEVNKALSTILINVTMPCMILYSFNFKFSMSMLKNAIMILFYSIAIHVFLIVLSKLLYFKSEDSKKKVFEFATIFSNCGFVGYPVVQGIFGNVGVFYTSIFTIPFNVFMWSYGIMIFTGEKDLKKVWKNVVNIPLISIFLGVLMFIFSVPLPKVLTQTLSSIGNMTTPISMFIIGAMLADVELKEVFKGLDVYYMNFIKLIGAPLLVYLILKLLGTNNIVLCICVILVAMPTGSLVGVFAERYNGNKAVASKCVFLTTVLSMITIPAIMAIM
ncbi:MULTISPECIES: AEC family transporter [Clostridium]|uniref:AEC family transporter n=1 Tax=Clostridium TaxID=1485 RepID=UPI000826B9E0|nr:MULTISPECIES: AEC family transporter [Clostridium]